MFDDENDYQKVIDDFNKESIRIIEGAHKKIFKQYKISNKNFDESVQALYSDPEVSNGLNFMMKPNDEFEISEIK